MLGRPHARSPLLVLLAAAAVVAAGCIGGEVENTSPSGVDLNESDDGPAQNATLPDGRGVSSGLTETNKTEQGIGGREHKHDYWKGQTSVVVYDARVSFFPFPVYPDGEGSAPKSVAYVKLPQPNLVFEGTDRVVVEASAPAFSPDPSLPSAPLPAGAPSLALQYRSAADSTWRDPLALAFGTPLDVKVLPKETDMPHSVSSLWVFRITSDRTDVTDFQLKITVHKGMEVADWPGHPDFYADKPWRVVLDKDVKTHMNGAQEGFLYDSAGTWVHPEKLVSYGTSRLEVFVNVTKITSSTGAAAESYFLEYYNATIIGPEISFGTRLRDGDGTNDLKSYNFTVPVDEWGMDGPYQPESRWGLRLLATFAGVRPPAGPSIGLCPGCFPYDIEYHIKVIAVSDRTAAQLSP